MMMKPTVSETHRTPLAFHEPVMVEEVLESLSIQPGNTCFDGTLGTGGHSLHIAEQLDKEGTLVAVDRDAAMLAIARERLSTAMGTRQNPPALILEHATYAEAPAVLQRHGIQGVDALLLDVGINSLHVDQADRGFSFSKEGPLDGRFNPNDPTCRSVAQLVNESEEAQLANWIYELSDERLARKIARAIVTTRESKPFETTTELAALVWNCYPANKRYDNIHPATRTFQALRIVANNELEEMRRGLRACLQVLNPGGRMTVLSFQSLEDRMVKELFDELGSPKPDPGNPYSATTRAGLKYEVKSRGARKPSETEIARNPRSRSTRLRTIQRLGGNSPC